MTQFAYILRLQNETYLYTHRLSNLAILIRTRNGEKKPFHVFSKHSDAHRKRQVVR